MSVSVTRPLENSHVTQTQLSWGEFNARPRQAFLPEVLSVLLSSFVSESSGQ